MKADIREAIDTLNSNAVEGIAQLRHLGFESDDAVANVLIAAGGVDRSVLGNFLHKEEGKSVCRAIARSCSKEGGTVVDGMRMFFRHFRLPKESQQITRILDILSDQYFEDLQNGRCTERDQKTLLSQKAVLRTIFSMLMLHTDQHHPEIRRRMTEKEWIMNNEKMNDGEDVPTEFLVDV